MFSSRWGGTAPSTREPLCVERSSSQTRDPLCFFQTHPLPSIDTPSYLVSFANKMFPPARGRGGGLFKYKWDGLLLFVHFSHEAKADSIAVSGLCLKSWAITAASRSFEWGCMCSVRRFLTLGRPTAWNRPSPVWLANSISNTLLRPLLRGSKRVKTCLAKSDGTLQKTEIWRFVDCTLLQKPLLGR